MQSKQPKILAIDDSCDNLTTLKAVVADVLPGTQVLTALTGWKGLQLARAEDPDVILLDIIMPEMDGFEVCRKLKKDKNLQRIPVLFLTALKSSREIRLKALDAGAEAFLSKPFEETELIAQILSMTKIKAANLHQFREKERLEELVMERTFAIKQELLNRRKVEQELFLAKQFSQQIINCAGEGIIVYGRDQRYQLWNPYMEQMTGILAEEVLGHHLLEIFPLFDEVGVVQTIKKILAGDNPKTIEFYYNLPLTGRAGWASHTSSPLRNQDGGIIGVIGIVQDITERKMAEESLRISEAKYRLLIENQNDLVIKTDVEGCYLYASPSYCQLFGKKEEELLGNTYTPLVHKDDLQAVQKAIAAMFQPPYTCSYEERAKTILGWRWIQWEVKAVFGERNTIIALVGTGRDITERKEMEKIISDEREKFRTTLLSVGDGVIVTDRMAKIELMNVVAEQLSGWTQQEALDRPFTEIFNIVNEYTRTRSENPVQKVLATGNIIKRAEHTILISKEGIERSIEDIAAPVKDKDGNINGVVLVFRDYTEKKEKQKEIEYLSFHDQLTGLYNRGVFEEELKRLDNERNLPLTLVMGDINGLKLTNDAFGHFVGDKLLKKAAEVMKKACRTDDIIARIGGDEFVIILPKTDSEQTAKIVNRINHTLANENVDSIMLSISFGWEIKQSTAEEMTTVFKKAEDNMYRRKLSESTSMRYKIIEVIIKTLYEKNEREQQHSSRVSQLCEALGAALGLNMEDISELRTVGLMHDIGKIILDDRILDKPDILGDLEWFEIKRHAETGYRILSSVNEFSQLAEYVLAHHERWDGKGYPRGLKGEKIPLESRIIAVADTYDAMTSDRPYRKALSEEFAIKEIRRNAGTQFDPDIARVFVEKVLGTEWD